jgi:hypothetical protein
MFVATDGGGLGIVVAIGAPIIAMVYLGVAQIILKISLRGRCIALMLLIAIAGILQYNEYQRYVASQLMTKLSDSVPNLSIAIDFNAAVETCLKLKSKKDFDRSDCISQVLRSIVYRTRSTGVCNLYNAKPCEDSSPASLLRPDTQNKICALRHSDGSDDGGDYYLKCIRSWFPGKRIEKY